MCMVAGTWRVRSSIWQFWSEFDNYQWVKTDWDGKTCPAQQCAAVKTQFSSEFHKIKFPSVFHNNKKVWMAFLLIFILKGDSQPMIEPPQKWVSPMAPTERRDTWGERRSYLERELLPGIWTLTWNLNSHLEGELSIVGNLASNNPSLTSLKSQWQSWNRFQLLEKVSKYLSSEKWESDLCSQGRATESK